MPARHYLWIPAGVKHSIHPSTPEVVMRNLYFPKRITIPHSTAKWASTQ
ncbi:hypothetical protein [Sphingobacterium sp. E70]